MKIFKTFGKLLFVLFCIALFAAVFFTSCSVTYGGVLLKSREPWLVEWNDNMGTILRDVDMEPDPQAGYDLYLPGTPQDKDYALILYMHGGGYTSGDKADGEMLCKFYASQGYVCASVNYPLSQGGTSTNMEKIFQQLRRQVSSIKEKASEKGYRITAMATSGDSAGGHLAMLYAYREPETSPIPVKLVFQMTGPASFEPAHWGITEPGPAAQAISQMTGTMVMPEWLEREETKALIASISPTLLVNANTVPTVLAYGPKDKVVPTNIKYPLIDALKENCVDYTYVEFPHSGHAMARDPEQSWVYVNTVAEYLDKYLPA